MTGALLRGAKRLQVNIQLQRDKDIVYVNLKASCLSVDLSVCLFVCVLVNLSVR